jgi:hypothetical protein
LAYAQRQEPDPFKGEIPNVKIYLAKKLEALSNELGSKLKITQLISSNLNPEVQNHLQAYFKLANITLK